MSYCRWSTDDFACDLYCYEAASGGWATHVATHKRVYAPPLPPAERDYEAACERHRRVMAMKEGVDYELVPIGLPHDGESFNDPYLESFRARIVELRALGYICPDSVLTDIDDEIAEATK